ncbi:MAG: phenylalanine--tRNA ligase subunit beta, partial [Acidimicrobiia bacterium]|nr:phenylalanine--tRNA ligase subunit beta [Acidimicrobiia bacterium]
EASTRYERGVDPYGVERALDRFVELAIEICGAKVASGVVVTEGELKVPPPVEVRVDRVNLLLNTDLTDADITSLLDPIGFTSEPVPGSQGTLLVTIPSWRPDSSLEIDVIEEIARHHGYDKSGLRVPTPTQAGRLTPAQIGRRRIRRALLGAGYSEAMPMPFLAPDDQDRAGLAGRALTLANPLVAEESVLRTSLLPGLMKSIGRNQSHRNPPVKLYELGRVFAPVADESESELPNEYDVVAGCQSGFADGADGGETAAESAVKALYRLAAELGLQGLTIANADVDGLHPTRAATVRFRGLDIGSVGEVDPRVLDNYEIQGRVAWFALRVEPILAALESAPRYKQISLYPSSDIDLAFVVPDEVPATDVVTTLRKAASRSGGDLLQSVELFDVYRGEQLGEGRRSLAYRLRFQASDRTLTDEEVAAVRQQCIDAVVKYHDAQLR